MLISSVTGLSGDAMISRDEVLMGRDKEYPLTPELEANLQALLKSLNQFRDLYGIPMIVSSGYRPGHYNTDAGGAKGSAHMMCEACDFRDSDGSLDFFCANRLDVLEQCKLYLEMPKNTPGWCHLTVRPPKSGNRIFIP